jgi:hypothetical protein
MKAEIAELFELFLHDEHGIGLVEFNDYTDRSISRRNGIKLVSDSKVKYISEDKIDSYRLTTINDKYVIACTKLDSKKAVDAFNDFMIEKCKQQITAHQRAFDKFGFLSTWENRLNLLKNPHNGSI